MKEFQLSILAPDGTFYEGACESLVVPASDGQYGILANHRNMISGLVPGSLSYTAPGEKKKYLAVSYGFVKVENNEVLVMVDAAELPENIDAARAQADADAAQEKMLQQKSLRDYRMAQADLNRAMNRLRLRKSYEEERLV